MIIRKWLTFVNHHVFLLTTPPIALQLLFTAPRE